MYPLELELPPMAPLSANLAAPWQARLGRLKRLGYQLAQ